MNTKEEQKQYLSFVESVDELLNDFLGDEDILSQDEEDEQSEGDRFISSMKRAIDTYINTPEQD